MNALSFFETYNCHTCYLIMSKQKYKPLDSEQDPVKDDQAVTDKQAEIDQDPLADHLKNPERKRKFSEQPHSKQNPKT
ncbi:hypothetical protein SAMN05216436_11050 [bacterium A37T11]|nr:hypothetical protein SAMN05216436_11050 [bacterium A37T11]